MYARISKTFDFAASHRLDGLPDDHPCSRLHGHNYVVKVTIEGEVDDVGFVIDYRALSPVKAYLDGALDHQHLNDVLPPGFNPTAEHLADHLARRVRQLVPGLEDCTVAVAVSETPKTWAEVDG